jgi:hypothetical protein
MVPLIGYCLVEENLFFFSKEGFVMGKPLFIVFAKNKLEADKWASANKDYMSRYIYPVEPYSVIGLKPTKVTPIKFAFLNGWTENGKLFDILDVLEQYPWFNTIMKETIS